MLEVVIPGKAFEIADKSKLDKDIRLSLKMGEKKNKGRGYRVFANLTADHAKTLARFFASLDPKSLSLVDAQAVKSAKERLYEATGLELVQTPKPVKVEKPKENKVENRGRKMREKTSNEIWKTVFPLIESRHCNCELRPGMDFDDLKDLGAGCTDPHDYKYKVLKLSKPASMSTSDRLVALSTYAGHSCPVLDTYRRAVEKLNPPKKVEDNEFA